VPSLGAREEAIREASDAGVALRPIATAAGYSVEWMRTVVRNESKDT
jgi:hypothetical protein